jgi:cell division septum initiation protein DivIVA
MAKEADSRLRAAEGRILGLRHELAVVQAELGDRDAQIQNLGTQIEAFTHDPDRSTPNMLASELDSILSSAQQTATRMIERAKAVSDRHLEQATDLGRELHEDLARMDAWRQQALPLIRAVQSRIAEIGATLMEVAESVAETARPLEQLPSIDRRVSRKAAATEDISDEPTVAKLDPAAVREGGSGQRARRRAPRARPAKAETAASSEVIEIPDQARAH